LIDLAQVIDREATAKLSAYARLLAQNPALENTGPTERESIFERFCKENGIAEITLEEADGSKTAYCGGGKTGSKDVTISEPLEGGGRLTLRAGIPVDLAAKQVEIQRHINDYEFLRTKKKETRQLYIGLLLLITLFILFAATWLAQFMARQISSPIAALLGAAEQVRSGNLAYRVRVGAIDELATLVRGFNEMTEALETSSRELEHRRRFTEAILESIPTGVISVTSDGKIQKVNRALKQMLKEERVGRATRLDDLFSRDDTAEIRYLMKRARRTGVSSRTLDLHLDSQVMHLAVTVAALEEKVTSGFVLVLEDTSELLRAQKAAAWHEVARRIAHEIKNPLTPIALSAERIERQVPRIQSPEGAAEILKDCSATILQEVQSVKTLVDEFTQFARFPAAQPSMSDLNEVVENALGVFSGRLDGIELHKYLSADLPMVCIDREHFKRVVINLVDNAAEAMQEAYVKRLFVSTQATSGDAVELIIADTGCGISTEDKEKLFLPYFSTKGRGTGLGLAIVNHIIAEHNAQIRIEDNIPSGARFIIELPVPAPSEIELRPVEARA
jgi:PAS domain S-box-containing protein